MSLLRVLHSQILVAVKKNNFNEGRGLYRATPAVTRVSIWVVFCVLTQNIEVKNVILSPEKKTGPGLNFPPGNKSDMYHLLNSNILMFPDLKNKMDPPKHVTDVRILNKRRFNSF